MSLAIPAAYAGQSCEEKPLTIAQLSLALDTARSIEAKLNASESPIVILGRQGQDLSKYQLKYSHVGFAIKEASGWRITELLNECGSRDSKLWVDGLGSFFLDDPFTYDAVLMIPPLSQQHTLYQLLSQRETLHELHTHQYNMVAYPFSTRYQNSNQWVLELTAAAIATQSGSPLHTRKDIQRWLHDEHYQPTELHIGAFTRLGGRMTKANIAFDDHPNEFRFSDRINTVTVESMVAFLKRFDWQIQEVRPTR